MAENDHWAPVPDGKAEYDEDEESGLVVWSARPIYRPPTEMRFFNFGVQHRRGTPVEPPFGDDFDEVLACLPTEVRATSKPTHYRPPASQDFDWGVWLGGAAAIWELLGLPGVIQLGQKARAWLQKNKGRSGDAGALLAVAILHITETYPDAQPSTERVQVLNPVKLSGYTRHHQVVYLYRIYDVRGTHVYVVEMTSTGHPVSCTQRPIGMFESPGHHGDLKLGENSDESDPLRDDDDDDDADGPTPDLWNPAGESWDPTSER
jgi:hypothetical protein